MASRVPFKDITSLYPSLPSFSSKPSKGRKGIGAFPGGSGASQSLPQPSQPSSSRTKARSPMNNGSSSLPLATEQRPFRPVPPVAHRPLSVIYADDRPSDSRSGSPSTSASPARRLFPTSSLHGPSPKGTPTSRLCDEDDPYLQGDDDLPNTPSPRRLLDAFVASASKARSIGSTAPDPLPEASIFTNLRSDSIPSPRSRSSVMGLAPSLIASGSRAPRRESEGVSLGFFAGAEGNSPDFTVYEDGADDVTEDASRREEDNMDVYESEGSSADGDKENLPPPPRKSNASVFGNPADNAPSPLSGLPLWGEQEDANEGVPYEESTGSSDTGRSRTSRSGTPTQSSLGTSLFPSQQTGNTPTSEGVKDLKRGAETEDLEEESACARTGSEREKGGVVERKKPRLSVE